MKVTAKAVPNESEKHMRTETGRVELKVGIGENAKVFGRDYSKSIFETSEDVIEWLQDPAKQVELLRDLNYGHDLKKRGKVRQALDLESAGPDKAINKIISDLNRERTAAGKPVLAYEVARERAMRYQAQRLED